MIDDLEDFSSPIF